MPASDPKIPNHRERGALHALRDGSWIETRLLHPSGETTLDKMAAKGWLEKDGLNGLYRISKAGLLALTTKIPLMNRKRPR